MDTLTAEFKQLQINYAAILSKDDINRTLVNHLRNPKTKHSIRKHQTTKSKYNWCSYILWVIIPVLTALCGYAAYLFHTDPIYLLDVIGSWAQPYPCLLENNMFIREVTRPGFNCSICKDLDKVPVVDNISQNEFAQKYAFTGVPVLVKGATKDWSAVGTFSFEFFKAIYSKEALEITKEECQFFAYNTDFTSLEEAFNMSEDRVRYKEGEQPWYFGWSNCADDVRQQLREHYSSPGFLPDGSETSSLDWIFMGGPGQGAHIHLDNVGMPSWQAQLSGSKTWYLYPVPECETVCSSLHVTLKTGDILVVDTNQWFHSTVIHKGDLSITIGSEYN